MHHNKPPTILDIPINAEVGRRRTARSDQPGRRQGHRRTVDRSPAAARVLCALADAVGDDIIRRTPVQPEHIMPQRWPTAGKPMMHNRFTAFI